MKKKRRLPVKRLLFVLGLVLIYILGRTFYENRHAYLISHKAVPEDLIYEARIPDMPDVRIVVNPDEFDFSDTMTYKGKKTAKSIDKNKAEATLLVLSGGGPDGAFGAGFLAGLSDSGKRPQYDIVTGVSTGALTAPAAFIGTSYDSVLEDIYTKVSDKDILGNDIKELLLGKRFSIFNLKPLKRVLRRSITPELVNAIADEYEKGRQLYVLTTNLDARRVVVWDMGAIAAYRTKKSFDLFREVVVASSSIPAAFPPMRIQVEAGGQLYEELHVDGSIGTQMFGSVLLAEQIKDTDIKGRIFVIRNGKMWADPGPVRPSLTEVAGASLGMLIANQAYMDLIRIYTLSQNEGVDFNCAFVPQDFKATSKGMFDPVYMGKLYKLGYDKAMSKEPWQKAPVSGSRR